MRIARTPATRHAAEIYACNTKLLAMTDDQLATLAFATGLNLQRLQERLDAERQKRAEHNRLAHYYS